MLPSKRDVRKVPALRYDFAYRIAIILANLWKFVSTAIVQTVASPTLSQMLAWLNRKLASCFDGSQNVYPLDDILAGIFLNVKEVGGVKLERSLDANSRPAWMVDGPPVSPKQKSEDWQLVTRCMELSVAMYNYPMFLLLPSSNWLKIVFYTPWNILVLVLGRLFAYLRTLLVPLPIGREIVGDGLLCKRTAAFMASSGSKNNDLQFASFLNGACQTPFAIVLDHPTKSIIIAIRGSTSLVDWITDFYIFPRTVPEMFRQGKWLHLLDEMNPEGTNPPIANTEVHGGMFLTAVYIYGMAIRIISPLRDPSPIGDGRTGSYSDYKIVVTGHSLGAGVASLLTLLLRVTYMKPTDEVRGYCFSPPGCMVSHDLLERTKDLVYSIVVGDDIVPRLSIQAANKLRLEVEARINERNKRSGLTSSNSTKNGPATVANAVKNSDYGNEVGLDYIPELFVPGHVLHLCQDPRTRAITSEWVKNESLQQIVLTNNLSMLKDHVPNRVERILKRGGTVFDYLPYVPFVTDLLESIY